jgi:hypothetical protein
MLQPPVLVVSRDALSSLPREEILSVLNTAVKQLPWQTQDAYMKLARSRGGDTDAVDDVFQTNAMGVEIGDVRYLGVVPEAAVS